MIQQFLKYSKTFQAFFDITFCQKGCYTICSLSDKYAVYHAKFTGNEFTFLMCSSMSVFITCSLPVQKIWFVVSWQSFAAILLIAICKMLEFQMSALVLKQLSAFELKAWLGTTLFVSYITDIIYGADMRVVVLFIKVSPIQIVKKNPSGVLVVTLARIPNAIGMLLENAVIQISLTNYSLIQPMILVTLFAIGLVRRENQNRLNLLGSILCAVGIVLFQFV